MANPYIRFDNLGNFVRNHIFPKLLIFLKYDKIWHYCTTSLKHVGTQISAGSNPACRVQEVCHDENVHLKHMTRIN